MSLIAIIGKLIGPIAEVIDRVIPDKNVSNHLTSQIQKELMEKVYKNLEQELDAQVQVLLAEAKGDLWIQKAWRPIAMLAFTAIVFFYTLLPAVAGTNPPPLPDQIWYFLDISMGGYIVGRSAEKILKKP
jgi:hypothetical protein